MKPKSTSRSDFYTIKGRLTYGKISSSPWHYRGALRGLDHQVSTKLASQHKRSGTTGYMPKVPVRKVSLFDLRRSREPRRDRTPFMYQLLLFAF